MHARQQSSPFAVVIFVLITGLLPAANGWAQTADRVGKSANSKKGSADSLAAKTTTSRSPNVKNGTIAAFDAAADTVTLREQNDTTGTYVLTDKTHFHKNKRLVQRADFKAGEAVVLRFRKSRTDGALLISEMDDPASWMWLTDIRKSTTPALVKDIGENTLSVIVGPERVPLDYVISDKTRWERAGKEVEASAFKAGDTVYIVPRSLPSGGIMARAVADSTTAAAQEKERLATRIHGAIVSIEAPAHKLTLNTLTGDTRNLAYTDETEVFMNGKPEPFSSLKSGKRVAARIRREDGGDEVVWRITIETTKNAPSSKKRAPTSKKSKSAPGVSSPSL